MFTTLKVLSEQLIEKLDKYLSISKFNEAALVQMSDGMCSVYTIMTNISLAYERCHAILIVQYL